MSVERNVYEIEIEIEIDCEGAEWPGVIRHDFFLPRIVSLRARVMSEKMFYRVDPLFLNR
jgi:hypothetical protein